MSSLLQTLGIGSRGLSTSETSLSVTGQNISNANTEGYSRKRIEQTAQYKKDGAFGQVGYGVQVDEITRMRDVLLDKTIAMNQSDLGMHTQIDESMTRMEALLTEPRDEGLGTALSAFWSSWQDLANNPEDVAARQAVINASQAVVEKFHSIAGGIQTLRSDEDVLLESKIKDVNKLLERVSIDNKGLVAAEGIEGGKANDSRDDRQQALKELSKLIDIDYTEDEKGYVTVTTGGQMIVTPSTSVPLTVEKNPVTLPDGSSFAITSVGLSSTRQPLHPRSGELAGIIEARDNVIPAMQAKFDALANALAQNVNAVHRQGFDAQGSTGTNFFDPTKVSAATLALLPEISKNPLAVAVGEGGSTRSPAAPVQATVPPGGTPLDLSQTFDPSYRNLLTGSVVIKTTDVPPVTLQEGAGKDYVVDPVTGRISFTNYLANPAGKGITVDFRYNSGGSKGAGDGRNALRISQLKDQLLTNPDWQGTPTSTITDSYANMVSSFGADHTTVSSRVGTLGSLDKFYGNQAQSVAGVNLDEEMTNLVKFQHSYQASAKFISTASQMLDTLLNL